MKMNIEICQIHELFLNSSIQLNYDRRSSKREMKDTKVLTVPLEAEQDFPKFLKRVRNEENVYLEQLAEGLMTGSQLARIEKGQRPIPKNMRDRLLGRLGIASDLYENLLNIEDYAAWEQQRDILCAIESRESCRAQELLNAYENQESDHDKVKQQFCFMMKAEILKQQKAEQKEIAKCYEKAVKLTVPDIENLCVEKKLLSIQEINMILEYEFYHKNEDFAERCKDLMRFVENTVYDDLSKVKVYPKIVYYYLQEIFSCREDMTLEDLDENLQICNKAIEMLRDTGRAFFLIELLDIRIKLLEGMKKEQNKDEKLNLECQESKELAELLKKLFEENKVQVYMQDCTYLYQQRWVFYIGDVLRIRRKMYGLTQKELCKGICSARTLRRAEKKEANMQREYLTALLKRLGLSKEYQRARLVTNDREVLKLKKEIFSSRNNRDFNRCRELTKQIQEKLSLKIPENMQYMIELKASLDWMENKITREEFVAREEEALQCTLKIKKLFGVDDIYLTELEILCIYKKMQGLEGQEKRKCIDFLLSFFGQYEKEYGLAECMPIFELVIWYIASELGNMGEYQLAADLDKKNLEEVLKYKRIWIVDDILYNILWNEMKQQRKDGRLMSKEKMTEKLKQCILLSHLYKQTFHEKFYCSKLNQSRSSSIGGKSLHGATPPSSE